MILSTSSISSSCETSNAACSYQSIGFIGPGTALVCLNYAMTPTVAAIFITMALSLSSFSQAGFLLNMHVSCCFISTKKHTKFQCFMWAMLIFQFWLFDQDIAPQYAGFLQGITLLICCCYCLINDHALIIVVCSCNLCNNIRVKSFVFFAGISNSAGTVAAIISTISTGLFVQWLGSFQAFLTLTACLYFATTIFWNLYATGEKVF